MSGSYPARLMRNLAAELRAVVHASTMTHSHLRDRVVSIVLLTAAVDLVCAGLGFWFEHDAKGTQIHTFGSAIFWTSTQLLTVSSQLPNPISTPGRVLDVAMEAYAISVVATLAGVMGAFLVRRGHEIAMAAAAARIARGEPPFDRHPPGEHPPGEYPPGEYPPGEAGLSGI